MFPEGFCLGKIVSHVLQEKELYHRVEIEPLINLERLRYCLLTSYDLIQTATKTAALSDPTETSACTPAQPGLILNQPAINAQNTPPTAQQHHVAVQAQ